ncbi:hypothetical protein LLH03_03225 [bacterium]|nr:hypothetical protein [bacterium]
MRGWRRLLVFAVGVAAVVAAVVLARQANDTPARQRDVRLSKWVRQVLARPDFHPVWSPRSTVLLEDDLWVADLRWPSGDQLVVVTQWPSLDVTREYRLLQITTDGQRSALGALGPGRLPGDLMDIFRVDGRLLCGSYDVRGSLPCAVFELREGKPPTEVQLDSGTVDHMLWWTVDDGRGGDALWRGGHLKVWSGRGRLLARGSLPPSVHVAHCEVRPTWLTDTAAVGAFGSVPGREWMGEEVLYADLSIISVPLIPGGEARVLRQFRPATEQELPAPSAPLQFTMRTIDDYGAGASGSYLAFWEDLRFDLLEGGRTILHRLWVWDEKAGSRKVAASFADCEVEDGSYRIEIYPDRHMRKTPQQYDCWGDYPRCTLSPDGRWLAYNIGKEVRLVDLTKPWTAP